jgi:hypothetical protein
MEMVLRRFAQTQLEPNTWIHQNAALLCENKCNFDLLRAYRLQNFVVVASALGKEMKMSLAGLAQMNQTLYQPNRLVLRANRMSQRRFSSFAKLTSDSQGSECKYIRTQATHNTRTRRRGGRRRF